MPRGNWSRECCEECGNEGLASRGEEVPSQESHVCSDCKLYEDAFSAGYEARKKDEKLTEASDRTPSQRHSNFMLFMRRMMGGIAQVMRVDEWVMWMDADSSTPEPDLTKEDLDAYLTAAGYTEERIEASLSSVMAIVEKYGYIKKKKAEMAEEENVKDQITEEQWEKVRAARVACEDMLSDLSAKVFEPRCKLTLIMRDPETDDCSMVVSNDDIGGVIKTLRGLQEDGQSDPSAIA